MTTRDIRAIAGAAVAVAGIVGAVLVLCFANNNGSAVGLALIACFAGSGIADVQVPVGSRRGRNNDADEDADR